MGTGFFFLNGTFGTRNSLTSQIIWLLPLQELCVSCGGWEKAELVTPLNTQRIPNGSPLNSQRIPNCLPLNSQRIPTHPPVNSQVIPNCSPVNSQRISAFLLTHR